MVDFSDLIPVLRTIRKQIGKNDWDLETYVQEKLQFIFLKNRKNEW